MIVRQASAKIPSPSGMFELIAYAHSSEEQMPHLAIVAEGALEKAKSEPIPVRLHSECFTGDVLGSRRCDCGEQLDAALDYIDAHQGIVLYLRQEGRGIGLINKLKAYKLQDTGLNTVEANVALGLSIDGRRYEEAHQMLKDLGVSQIQLLTNNPLKVHSFEGSGIEVVERLAVLAEPHSDNRAYLKTKKDLMGHFLTSV